MRVPLTGICTGFRVRSGGKTSSDYGELDIIQVGTKDHQTALTIVYVKENELLEYLLKHYSSGQLKWISVLIYSETSGRETLWMLQKVFDLDESEIEIDHE